MRKVAHEVEQEPSQQNASAGAKQREQYAFGKQLAQQARAPAPMATRMAISRSRLTPRANSSPATLTQPMASTASTAPSRVHSGPLLLLFTLSANSCSRTVRPCPCGICQPKIVEDVRQIGLRLLHVVPVFEARHGLQPVVAAAFIHGRSKMNGCIDGVALVEREAKSGGHDADHCIGAAIQLDRRVQDPSVATEVVLPGVVTEHHDVVFALLFFAWQEGAAQQGLDAEDLEKIVGRAYTVQRHRAAGRSLQRDLRSNPIKPANAAKVVAIFRSST